MIHLLDTLPYKGHSSLNHVHVDSISLQVAPVLVFSAPRATTAMAQGLLMKLSAPKVTIAPLAASNLLHVLEEQCSIRKGVLT